MLQPGARLGPYEILALVGKGGMGEVYRARDTRLDRTVAIKLLAAELAESPGRRERFEREARAISSLNHPHICTVHDIGRHDGRDFLVMEDCEGETLADRLAKRPLGFDLVVRYGIEIAAALDAAHGRGITHRDLKPANIMLTATGVKLLDFGLAKSRSDPAASALASTAAGSAEDLTREGAILGTLHYMAPEQLEGRETDARTDIFALGAVLYEMATGHRPFDGASRASVIASILEREPEPVTSVQPETPFEFERLVTRCLAKSPEARWQSVRDVAAELRWLADGPPGRRPRRRRVRAGKDRWLQRERMTWFAIVAILLLTLAGFLYRLRDAGSAAAGRPRVRIAVHRQGTVAGVLGEGVIDVLSRTLTGTDVELVEEPGMMSTIRALDDGRVDVGLAFNLLAFHAVKTDQALGHRSDGITALTVGYPNPAQIVVRSGSGVKNAADLEGKRVSLGIIESGERFCSQIVLSHLGLDPAHLADQFTDLGPSLANLLEGRLDAYISWRALPTPDLTEAFATGKLALVAMEPDSVQGLRLHHPFLVPWTIPARAYPHQEAPVPTVSARILLLGARSLSPEVVERMLRAIAHHTPDLVARHPAAAEFRLNRRPTMDDGLSIDLHPGAERFFASVAEP